MKKDSFAKVMLFLILLALIANLAARVFAPTVGEAQVPQALIAQATDKVAAANERVAMAIERLAASVQESNSRIASAIQKSAAR